MDIPIISSQGHISVSFSHNYVSKYLSNYNQGYICAKWETLSSKF